MSFLTHAELLEVYMIGSSSCVGLLSARFSAERFVPARVEYGPKGLSVHVDGIALAHESCWVLGRHCRRGALAWAHAQARAGRTSTA